MTIQQIQRRQIAREILTYIMQTGSVDNILIAGQHLHVVRVLERAGVVSMDANGIDIVIADNTKARHLVYG